MIAWFKKHPEFLRAESKALGSNGNYKELFQKRLKFLVSHGNILVRHNGTARHPILIFYLNSTPYSLPEVFPLSRQLTEAEVENIASGGQGNIPVDAIKYFYKYRHQNGSGPLCILETDNLDHGSSFFDITNVLGRVHEWFKAHITGEFPPDSEEVELSAHFTNFNNDLRLIYPAEFLDEHFVQGDFWALSLFSPNADRNKNGATFFGARLAGFTKAGIYENSKYPIHQYLVREGFISAADFETKKPLLQKHIDSGGYLKGFWFDVDIEPTPFKEVSELIDLIGNGDGNAGLSRLAMVGLNDIKTRPKQLSIAVRYKNRKDIIEFQLFTLHKSETAEGLVLGSDIEKIESALAGYNMVKAVKCEKYTEESFFQRNGKRAERSTLAKQTINVIGAGAIGGEIADCLNKAGVGDINILDNQVMGVQNTVRHIAGIEYMGWPKAAALRAILESHNPFINVSDHPINVKACEIGQIIPDNSVTVSSIADDNTEGFLNEQCVLYGKTVFYVRALRGGKAARIFRVVPGQDACFYCLQLYRDDKSTFIDVPFDPDYPTVKNECNNPIRPASAADLKLAASLASSIIIQQIDKPTKANHWIWSVEAIDGTPIDRGYAVKEQNIDIHPHCPYCNSGVKINVEISEDVLVEIKQRVVSKSGTETGGVLAGYTENGTVYITHASDAGPKAVEKRDRFEKDVEYCQAFLDNLYQQHGSQAVYVGEWHSHPNSNNKPSTTDLTSFHNIAMGQSYLVDKPVMIILSSTGQPSCTVHPAGKLYYSIDLKTIGEK